MSKINPSSNFEGSSISQNSPKSSLELPSFSASQPLRVEKKLHIKFDETGFYKREVKLLIDENGSLISTEGGDKLLLSIEDRDTIQFTSDISGLHNIDHG